MTAAEMGDFSILGKILGIDTTAAENWYKQSMALDVYSATGIVGILKDAGFDTSEIEKNMQNEEFKTDLSIALSVYDATGNPAMLNKLGIDTAYMDELLQLDLATAKKGASGSGSSGSGGSSGGTQKSTGSTTAATSSTNSFAGNDTTSYWINERLTEKQLSNYNNRNKSNISMASYAGDQLSMALMKGEISKTEYNYLCDYFGIK